MDARIKQTPVTIQELLISNPAQTDALANLLIAKGIITQAELLAKIAEERATYLEVGPGLDFETNGPVFRPRRRMQGAYAGGARSRSRTS